MAIRQDAASPEFVEIVPENFLDAVLPQTPDWIAEHIHQLNLIKKAYAAFPKASSVEVRKNGHEVVISLP